MSFFSIRRPQPELYFNYLFLQPLSLLLLLLHAVNLPVHRCFSFISSLSPPSFSCQSGETAICARASSLLFPSTHRCLLLHFKAKANLRRFNKLERECVVLPSRWLLWDYKAASFNPPSAFPLCPSSSLVLLIPDLQMTSCSLNRFGVQRFQVIAVFG